MNLGIFLWIASAILIGILIWILFQPSEKKNIENVISYQDKINDEVYKLVVEELNFRNQQELAELLWVSQWLISMINSDEHNIRETTYKKILLWIERLNKI